MTPAQSTSADLTSPHYWDRQWSNVPRPPVGIKPWLRRHLRIGPPKLFAFLAAQLDQVGDAPLDVLEIGCAPGTVLGTVRSLRPQHCFHGVDFAEQGLADAARRLSTASPSVMLHRADIREFHPGRHYDVVYSCGLIEHFSDPLPILQHHVRLCVPGGRVIVTVPNHTGVIREYLINIMDPAGLASHNLAVMSETALRKLLEAAGLEQITAGGFGRGVIRPTRAIERWPARALQMGVLAFNEATRVIPPRLLQPHVFWAAGTVRAAG